VGDFDAIHGFVAGETMENNATAYSGEITTWTAGKDSGDENIITLNDSALDDLKCLDEFKIVIVEYDHDYKNVAIANGGSLKNGLYFADSEDTDTDGYPIIRFTEMDHVHPEEESVSLIANDFTIRRFNVEALSVQYNRCGVEQVPFILGAPGPLSLRRDPRDCPVPTGEAPAVKLGDKKN
jgi:hypothetical protein